MVGEQKSSYSHWHCCKLDSRSLGLAGENCQLFLSRDVFMVSSDVPWLTPLMAFFTMWVDVRSLLATSLTSPKNFEFTSKFLLLGTFHLSV